MKTNTKSLTTITGQYISTGNPCTTTPCLPDMAYAIKIKHRDCFITINGKWLAENVSWASYMPQLNDNVTINGYLNENTDINGKPFLTIEALSLKPAKESGPG